MGFGKDTKNYAELSTTKFLIQLALEKNCRYLQIFGDSKVVWDWLNKYSICNAYTLSHILDEALRLITSFDSFTCHHIYREQNTAANKLSKEAANRDPDNWLI